MKAGLASKFSGTKANEQAVSDPTASSSVLQPVGDGHHEPTTFVEIQ